MHPLRRDMRIVMIDDSPADRKLYRVLLEQALGPGLEFHEAGNAAEGLEICQRVAPDCILLDYKLPDMDGLQFLAHLSPDESTNEVGFAVVMLTGIASEKMAADALRAGAQDYLVKDRQTPEGVGLAIEKATQKLKLIQTLREERDRLSRSLAEKETLIKEVHHRVKNNLQVIASLLRLRADSLRNPEAVAALTESQHRVEAMALVHEQLYASDDLREVDLAREAGHLLANLFLSYGVDRKRITSHLDIAGADGEPLVVGVDQAIPVGLILNELVSNALLHAFPGGRGGGIWVTGRRLEGRIHLEVRDDGVGMPGDFDPGEAKSLGLRIVHILARQLKGTVDLNRVRRASGASFEISFPEEESQAECQTLQTAAS